MYTVSRAMLAAAIVLASGACSRTDSSFDAMQKRGEMAMGVDQTTSTHRFDALPNGGRIELLRDLDDSLGIAQFVHMQAMPGTAVMAKKRDVIAYAYHDLPRGGEVVITTTDADALAAIHAFMGAQRMEHHASGAGLVSTP